MTTPITKEQLREYAEKKVKSLKFAVTQSAFTGITEGLEKELRLAEYALAAIDAEPVAWVCAHGDEIEYNGHNQFSGGRQGLSLYAAPPAPVVPEDISNAIEALKKTLVSCHRYNYCSDAVKRIENACRAAMLQGGKK